MIGFYAVILILLSIYSYSLVDPNLTLINHSLWVHFREIMIYLGYYQRELSWYIYFGLILFLFFSFFYFVKNYKKINLSRTVLIIVFILFFSYPFLSHDFFNYLFDAKIATFYHQNPYLHKALDFPSDSWLRFMHWTHRTYPYGPIFLLITLIPSLLSMGKFILNFILFKLMFIGFYLIGVYFLNKMNKKWAVTFATHPLVIVEGLISSHNDLIALSLALIGIYFLNKWKNYLGRILLLLSAGIKYITFPLVILTGDKKNRLNRLVLVGLLLTIGYLSYFSEIQPWYFLALFAFLPFYENLISNGNIFFIGLLLSYYPYIRLGGWDSLEKINIKHQIIFVFFLLNIFYILIKKSYKKIF